MLAALQSVALKQPPATTSPPLAAYAPMMLPAAAQYRAARGVQKRMPPAKMVRAARKPARQPRALLSKARRGIYRPGKLAAKSLGHKRRRPATVTLLARIAHAVRIRRPMSAALPKSRRRAAYHVFYPIGTPFFRLARAALRLNRRGAQAALTRRRRPRNLLRMMLALAMRHQRMKAVRARQVTIRRGPAHSVRQFIAATIIAYTLHLKRKVIPRVSTPPKVRRRMGYRVFYPIGMPFVRLAHAGLRLQRRIAQPKARRRPRILHESLLARLAHAVRIKRRPAQRMVNAKRERHLWILLTGLARGHRPAMRKQVGTLKSRRRGRHLWMLLTGLARGNRPARRKGVVALKPRRSERIKGVLGAIGFARGRQRQPGRWRRLLSFWRRPLRRRPPVVGLPIPPLSAPRLYFNATLDATIVFTAPLDQTLRSLSTLDATIVLGATML
jgi:hypothetical protein